MPAANDEVDPNDPNAATQLLWRQLMQPVPIVDVAQALFGLPAAISRQLSGALLATSAEANELTRCSSVRGPIQRLCAP